MAIALPALWLIALSLAFYLAAKLILTPMIVGILRRTPLIGRLLESAANGIVNQVEIAISKWIRPYLSTLVRWLKAYALATLSIPLAMVYFGAKIEAALKYLVSTKIMQMIRTVTNPIVRSVNATASAVRSISLELNRFEKAIQRSIEEGLRDLSADLLTRFRLGIDTLRRDVFGKAIPALESDIAKVARGAEADIARVGRDVVGVTRELADLAKRLNIPLSLLEEMIAAVGIVAALEALTTLAKCEPKLRSLCSYDPGLWDDFLLATLAVIAFPGFREMTLMGASIMDDAREAIIELANT